jgi:hypothetical protein
MGNKLKDAWGCDKFKSGNVRGIKFPPLSELRDRFDKRHGKQDWPAIRDGEDWGTSA